MSVKINDHTDEFLEEFDDALIAGLTDIGLEAEMGKRYKLSDYDENKEFDKDDVFVLDDRSFKYDEKNDRIVRPGEPGYDELPELIR